MAAGGFKEFVAGETLDENEINDYLMQGVLVFAGTAARGSAIGTPVEGQVSYLADSDTVEFYDSTQWVSLATQPGAAVISGTTGSPTVGTATIDGETFVHYTFTGDGSITVSDAGVATVLVVAGGGGGGSYLGGGGGGGGVRQAGVVLLSDTYTITVGPGGAKGTGTSNDAANGSNSSIGTIIEALGGGAGQASTVGNAGGSGGGGGANGTPNTAGGAGFENQGRAGAPSFSNTSPNLIAGGGGGRHETISFKSGARGISSGITGVVTNYAGGGGGGVQNAGEAIGVGYDGGGAGGRSTTSAGVSGTANTGGGGGGGGTVSSSGGNGGSGVVIVRVKN